MTPTTLLTFTGTVSGPSLLKTPYTIPAGTRVTPDGQGDYWLDDLSMIADADKHDATHYGFRIPREYVEIGVLRIETRIVQYAFNTNPHYSGPEKPAKEKADWEELRAMLEAREGSGRLMESHGGASHYMGVQNSGPVLLDTSYLFDNQWNTTKDSQTVPNRRVFDWAKDYESDIGAARGVKCGHYLEITPAMIELRNNVVKCGYCGRMESRFNGNTFHTGCFDSPYLKETELRLTRLLPVSSNDAMRAELSESERATLLPIYLAAQTKRREQVSKEMRKSVVDKCANVVAASTEERDGMLWLLDRGFPVDNVIYYAHTRTFCFGWHNPISESVLAELRGIVADFPFAYEIKTEGGRKV